MMSEVSLYKEALSVAQSIDSRYRDTLPGRDALLVFMDMNDWFGLTPEFRNKDVFISSVEPFRERLKLWLRAYKRTGEEKIDLMLEAYHEIFPDWFKIVFVPVCNSPEWIINDVLTCTLCPCVAKVLLGGM